MLPFYSFSGGDQPQLEYYADRRDFRQRRAPLGTLPLGGLHAHEVADDELKPRTFKLEEGGDAASGTAPVAAVGEARHPALAAPLSTQRRGQHTHATLCARPTLAAGSSRSGCSASLKPPSRLAQSKVHLIIKVVDSWEDPQEWIKLINAAARWAAVTTQARDSNTQSARARALALAECTRTQGMRCLFGLSELRRRHDAARRARWPARQRGRGHGQIHATHHAAPCGGK